MCILVNQIKNVLNKTRYFQYIANKLQHLPTKVIETINYAYVFSLFNCGLIIYCGAYKADKNEKSQLKKSLNF